MPASPHGIQFTSHRPVVMGKNGMVCSGHPLASQAGISILQKGGNAVDAAIATAAALNVVEPMMSGIGGDGFIMVYWKADNKISISNGTGAAPYAATRDRFLPIGIPTKGVLSMSVPGLVHSWIDTHEKFGSLPLIDLFQCAIDLAENGFPVTHYLSNTIGQDNLLCEFPSSAAIFTKNGKPLQPGDIIYQKDLAETLKLLAKEGREGFYTGDIARSIVDFVQSEGGLLTMKDMADCSARWQDPISTTYRGHTVYEAPPNSSGHILLQELNIIENFDISHLGYDTADAIHVMVEAKKLAFSDREAYVADPDYIDVPIEGLLSKDYASERAKVINMASTNDVVMEGNPWAYQSGEPSEGIRTGAVVEEEDTTCFVIADKNGNAVCQLQSLQSSWGSSIVAPGTGILLNNRMTYWHLDEDHIDCLVPGKRVRHTMNPVMVFNGDSVNRDPRGGLKYVLGTPGADTQVQANMQIISDLVDFGMTISEAVEAPRWKNNHSPTESNIPHICENELLMEGRFAEETIQILKDKGHNVRVLDQWDGVTGREMII
ncbi:MAG: gamma-glutamyltransferase, partial [Chloroflexota bacterium]|nr:gamma-glutamyltransferase [Chloroflexota bacterium]